MNFQDTLSINESKSGWKMWLNKDLVCQTDDIEELLQAVLECVTDRYEDGFGSHYGKVHVETVKP